MSNDSQKQKSHIDTDYRLRSERISRGQANGDEAQHVRNIQEVSTRVGNILEPHGAIGEDKNEQNCSKNSNQCFIPYVLIEQDLGS